MKLRPESLWAVSRVDQRCEFVRYRGKQFVMLFEGRVWPIKKHTHVLGWSK